MEIFLVTILIFIIFLQFAYIIYSDRESRKEREKLMLKFMSKDIQEYKQAIEPEPENAESSDITDDYVDTDDLPIEVLLEAEDRI